MPILGTIASSFDDTPSYPNARGLFGLGSNPENPSYSNVIDYVTIATLGNAIDFGDLLTTANRSGSGTSNSNRAIFHAHSDEITYVTITTTGNSIDFGNLTTPANTEVALSNGHGGL